MFFYKDSKFLYKKSQFGIFIYYFWLQPLMKAIQEAKNRQKIKSKFEKSFNTLLIAKTPKFHSLLPILTSEPCHKI